MQVIVHSPAFLKLLRTQRERWEHNWVSPLDQCNTEDEYDNDIWEDGVVYGRDVDDFYVMW